MMKFSIFAVLLAITTNVVAADDVEHKSYKNIIPKQFYDKKKEGWFWFEEDSVEKEKEKQPLLPPTTEPAKSEPKVINKTKGGGNISVEINAKWLRENLPVLREAAINKPTKENLAAYYYAQRMTVDMATRFATRSKEFFSEEAALDENNRRPTSSFILSEHKRDARGEKNNALSEIFKDTGLWVFVRSDCSFCKKQIPVLEELKRIYGVDILYISIDGEVIPGHNDENYVYDVSGIARERLGFEVSLTPTMVLMRNDGNDAVLLQEGLIDLTTLGQKTLFIAKRSGWIAEDDYMKTQQVRDITSLKGDDVLEVTVKHDSESKTQDIVDAIKKRLINQPRISGSKADK